MLDHPHPNKFKTQKQTKRSTTTREAHEHANITPPDPRSKSPFVCSRRTCEFLPGIIRDVLNRRSKGKADIVADSCNNRNRHNAVSLIAAGALAGKRHPLVFLIARCSK
ncbi:hypothetical protein CDAR_93881 [Caerostris darwini]|uniref:Uncharacterized protein n=1 Tax=Caerostris darwini TaxID=1538125 RepID=A0AAV4NJT6_9ARAC|nr:hypothetical protein CDAR_93881 [Caerostris darwini]